VQAGAIDHVKFKRGKLSMAEPFGALSTTDDVLQGVDLSGKRVLVTGVSAGIGVETARALVAHGAQVVGAVRDLAKGEAAAAEVKETAAAHGGNFELEELDLASLASVRALADRLVAKGERFDLVIANAGVMATPAGHTVDGFETQFGTNHLGHFTLINRIAPLIAPGGRVVIVASSGHVASDVDLVDPNFDHTDYNPFIAYGRSKTANILFAVEFDRRHKGDDIRATAVHPGGIKTELSRHMGEGVYEGMITKINADLAAAGKPAYERKTPAQGAATSLWAGVTAPANKVGGKYCENCHVSTITDGPIGPVNEGVRAYALDAENAKRLWAKSEELIGETFPETLPA
jgi:NAD(P)-dependent dehydrogenase (short-subunit alcohol dehydrogenase family)